MAVSSKLQEFLQQAKVPYTATKHPVVYTAQEIAAAQHVPGRQLAKCVLVDTDGGPVLAVLPAIELIDFKRLKGVLGTKRLSIAKEAEIKERFPDVEVGAMSPFGNLYNVPVVADRTLEEAGDIVFNAGTHTDTITMRYQDFARLVKPKTGSFGQPIQGKKPAKKSAAKSGKKTSRASRKPLRRSSKKPAKRRRL